MEIKYNPAKHLYGRGWLGLMPLVGGFVGIGLMLLGAFKYRDRKLVWIGALALSFTVVVYSSLFYYVNSQQGRKDRSKFSIIFLNKLVQSIEFYRSDKGKYPDSLQEVARDFDAAIYDPLGPPSPFFYYEKRGEKYVLFSCGVDGIAHTKDDIFPSPNYFSDKTGLIHP